MSSADIIKIIVYQASKLFWLFPIDNNKIYLLNFDGTIIGHDAKAVAEWVKQNNKSYKLIWGVKKNIGPESDHLDNVNYVRINSLRGLFHILTAKILIYNINPPSYFAYRKDQKLVNTWHGFIGKKIGKYTKGYSKRQFNLATCFMSETASNTKNIRDAFEYNGMILEAGAPRNDVFFSDNCDIKKKKIIKRFHTENKKILLYAPTFRGDFKQERQTINFEVAVKALSDRFGGEWVVFVRAHPMIINKLSFAGNNIIDVSFYNDTQELLCAADIVITDFSSVFFDFSLTKRPVFLYFDDISQYGTERGFLFSVFDLPFSISKNNEELKHNILSFNEIEYRDRLNNFYNKVGNFTNGHACEKLFDYIEWKE